MGGAVLLDPARSPARAIVQIVAFCLLVLAGSAGAPSVVLAECSSTSQAPKTASVYGYDAPPAATTPTANMLTGATRGERIGAGSWRSSTSSFAPRRAAKGAKRGPKPFGTGPHNLKIREIADSVTDGQVIAGGQRGLPEQLIPTPGGMKSGRRPDILVRRPDGSIYGINVGRTTRSSAPVKREAEALNDLEGAGIEMHYVPYR